MLHNVTLNIDGADIHAPKGSSVLEVAIEYGICIPHLCHVPGISDIGACRLCIVEIENMRGLPTACTTPATDGMVVTTHTPQLQKLRRAFLHLILTEHPNACLT